MIEKTTEDIDIQENRLIELWGAGGALPAIIYGVLWGVGGLTFGLSMRYLGVALGQSIALGTCAAAISFPRKSRTGIRS